MSTVTTINSLSDAIDLQNLNYIFQGSSLPVLSIPARQVARNERVFLQGESGSGKSTLGRSIMRLAPITGGSITFDGTDLSGLQGSNLKQFRRRMQMIFQDPYASLDPRQTVSSILTEPLRIHRLARPRQRRSSPRPPSRRRWHSTRRRHARRRRGTRQRRGR